MNVNILATTSAPFRPIRRCKCQIYQKPDMKRITECMGEAVHREEIVRERKVVSHRGDIGSK
jgi:hypothetical protein